TSANASASTSSSTASGTIQRIGVRVSVCGQRNAAASDAVPKAAASAIQTTRLSVIRAVMISNASNTSPATISRLPPPNPAGGGAISADMNGAIRTTHVDHGPTP